MEGGWGSMRCFGAGATDNSTFLRLRAGALIVRRLWGGMVRSWSSSYSRGELSDLAPLIVTV